LGLWPDEERKRLRRLIRPKRHQHWLHFVEEQAQVAKTSLRALTDADRLQFWERLFPKLAPHLERAWQDAAHRPYQHGFQARPFRAPNRQEAAWTNRTRYFVHVCQALWGLDKDATWLAGWIEQVNRAHWSEKGLSFVLAAVLAAGGPEADAVRQVLVDRINGEHEVGAMGHDIIVTLLNSPHRADWEIIGKLLLAARREEGLRQSILESVDEAQPEAFAYMLGLILEHDLTRFSATVRAFDVWLGMAWAGGSAAVVRKGVKRLHEIMSDPKEWQAALDSDEAQDVYFALWVTAYADAEEALRLAGPMISDPSPERRFVALVMLESLGLKPEVDRFVMDRVVSGEETSEHLQAGLCQYLTQIKYSSVPQELFEATAVWFEAFPKKAQVLEPIVWPWVKLQRSQRLAATALRKMAVKAPEMMIPYAQSLEGFDCANLIAELVAQSFEWIDGKFIPRSGKKPLSPEARGLLLHLAGDPREEVQEWAFKALGALPVEDDEVERLLSLLHRKSPTLRSGALMRLARLPDDRVLRLGEELLLGRNAKQRAAGVDLTEYLHRTNRVREGTLALLRKHRSSWEGSERAETAERLLGGTEEQVTLRDCLGLVATGSRAEPVTPVAQPVSKNTKVAMACLESLARLFIEHADTLIEVDRSEVWGAEPQDGRLPLAEYFPEPPRLKDGDSADPRMRLAELPLREVWEAWVAGRSNDLRDEDGLELIRAWAISEGKGYSALRSLVPEYRKSGAGRMAWSFRQITDWLPILDSATKGYEYLVRVAEDNLARLQEKLLAAEARGKEYRWKRSPGLASDFSLAKRYRRRYVSSESAPALLARLARLQMLAMDLGIPDCGNGPGLTAFVAAFDRGELNEFDFIWLLTNERTQPQSSWHRRVRGPIAEATALKSPEVLRNRPELIAALERTRDRILDVEIRRGELTTPATELALAISYTGGSETLIRLAKALGKDTLVRMESWGEERARSRSLSRLLAATLPLETDSLERFAEAWRESGVAADRLVEIAMFAPQWAGYIEYALEYPGLEDVVWWVHAHTRRGDESYSSRFPEMCEARIAERTEIEPEELAEGAVDVAWFQRLIKIVGEERWLKLSKPAKYASNSAGHKRAQLFADAMLGRADIEALRHRIDEKRNKDAVIALGLVPLPKAKRAGKAETLARYLRLQEFRRESRKFGSQRQASEGRAVDIAMLNLARSAGYRDPQRLQWAMEAAAVADLAKGAVVVKEAETTVSLAIDAEGDPQLTVVKKGKPLKNIPVKLRKVEAIAGLKTRLTELRRQRSRMRQSLEESMCRGDVFTAAELKELRAHPMLRPMIDRLVFVGESELVGYPAEAGKVLRDHAGRLEPIGRKDSVRLAHPIDLLERGDWSDWQRECFVAERVQPFKQIFREVYPKTESELGDCNLSRRYAGHQVNPRQALSLLKSRRWLFSPEDGVRRVYHDQKLIAELWFQEHFHTPAEVEGLTLEGVCFVPPKLWADRVLLSDVPDRLFSETMRDLDLVVSVAHSGGVDPEASASTLEMRVRLLEETCQLLKLDNVRLDGRYAKIEGKHAEYSVHLGSATTKIAPGRMLYIVAVHSQYRGRLFLPFADDDPRTAEVLTKVLLLARDKEIKDPSILHQIRG
jgi:Family of unknown function (DUF5724)/Domain of unknown function (DUF4132)